MKEKCCGAHAVSSALVIIGALNWGLIGVVKFNLVTALVGRWPIGERIVYVLVGLAALMLLTQSRCCPSCFGKKEHAA